MKVFILITLSFVYSVLSQYSAPCNFDDVGYFLTDCFKNTRNVYPYWKNQCDFSSHDSINLPESKYEVDCHTCEQGQFLTFNPENGQLDCDYCPRNTYSIGGGFRLNGMLKEWNPKNEFYKRFSSSCFLKDNLEGVGCNAWTPSDDHSYISAGASTEIKETEYIAKLVLPVKLIKKGKITFKYKKENSFKNLLSAKFKFSINYIPQVDVRLINEKWSEASFDLTPGFYSLEWEFSKKIYPENASSQEIQAAIELIEVDGLETADLTCKKCINSKSDAGSSECEFCNENFYYDETFNECLACPASFYSLHNSIGAGSCKPKEPCKEDDYQKVLNQQCFYRNNSQVLKYEWKEPFICDDKKGKSLPKNENVKCKGCQKGEYIQFINKAKDLFTCNECPSGTYSASINSLECIKCKDGSYPLFTLDLQEFTTDNLDQYFTNIGWIIQNYELIPDSYHNGNLHILEKSILIREKSGSVHVDFSIHDDLDPLYEYFQINLGGIIIENTNFNKKGNYEKEFKLGQEITQLRIEYFNSKNSTTIRARPNIKISSIKVENSTEGGGYACSECLDGYFDSTTNRCNTCPAGIELISNTIKACIKCNNGYMNENNSKCIECPAFTYSNGNACILSDVLQSTNNSLRFVINELTHKNKLNFEVPIGPIIDQDSSPFFISHKQPTNFTEKDFSFVDVSNHNNIGHIFGFRQLQFTEDKQISENVTLHENLKVLYNAGSRIEYVKLIKNYTSGIIIKYVDGDSCPDAFNTRYSSYLIMTCEKKKSFSRTFVLPIIVKNLKLGKCQKAFHWKSKFACRSCLIDELQAIVTPCDFSRRSRFYTENHDCSIHNSKDLIGESFDYNDPNLIIDLVPRNDTNTTLLDSELIELAEATQSQNGVITGANVGIFVNLANEVENCTFLEDLDEYLVVLIVIPTTYLIVAFAIVFYCLKYRKIKNHYMKLKDERESNSVITKRNQSQLEMSQTNRDGNSVITKSNQSEMEMPDSERREEIKIV